MKRTAAACVGIALLAACGTEGASPPGGSATAGDDGPVKYRGYGMVLQKKEQRPELCLGGVNDSLPPQCSGTPLVDWDWDDVPEEETAAGVTWGTYEVVGYYDGHTLTVLEAKVPPPFEGSDEDPIDSACPEPEGGWTIPDPARASSDQRLKTIHAAEDEPDFSGAWIDHFVEPTDDEELPANDDAVLNLAFTGDIEEHEAEIRELWGGALCVVEFEHTQERLSEIQNELSDEGAERYGLEVLYSDLDITRNTVLIGVTAVEQETLDAIDEAYGEGTVEVQARLQPIEDD